MNMKKTATRGALLLAALVMVAVAIGLMPQFGVGKSYAAAEDPASAAGAAALSSSSDANDDAPAMAMDASVLGVKANTADAQTVYMADRAWRVIGYDGNGAASAPGMVTLISSGFVKDGLGVYFSGWANTYSNSTLKGEVDAAAARFSVGERNAIQARDLASGSYDGRNTDCIAGDEVKGALLWPLSTKEACDMDSSFLAPGFWWLRSPGDADRFVAFVEKRNSVFVNETGIMATNANLDVRAAFYLNPESLIFTSAAEGGKSSGAEGADSLKPVGTNSSGAWKATVKSGHDVFKVKKVTANWGKTQVMISYEGAATGSNEHISAIIKDSSGNVAYYGNLKSCASAEDASGMVTVNVDGKLGNGDTLYVLNEQLNGDRKTDYASELVEVKIPAAKSDGFKEVTENTHFLYGGWYRVSRDVTINWVQGRPNGMRLAYGAKVYLYIDEGATLTVNGRSAQGNFRKGFAAIRVDANSTLIISGKGTLNATGGNAENGKDGRGAMAGEVNIDGRIARSGDGGSSGDGGGGAGAGIGTNGGEGGSYALGAKGASANGSKVTSNVYGNSGEAGGGGEMADPAGKVIITGSVTVNATGGKAGKGGSGGSRGGYREDRTNWVATAAGTSGGGGGGGGGSAADGIGSGGTGGGAGGAGASGNIDGESAFFKAADLDDLWGHGGRGGSSNWGGENGSNGDEGASNGGDSTGASTKYAKVGGSGGPCDTPKAVTFYTYSASGLVPTVTCKAGHDVTREATPINVKTFEEFGGEADMVGDLSARSAVLATMSAQSDDVSALSAQAVDSTVSSAQLDGSPVLLAQADGGAEPIWVDSGKETVEVEEGVEIEVDYQVAYYDEAGNPLDATPVDPGEYNAVVRYTCPTPYEDLSGDYTVPFSIDKRQVAVPTPAELTFTVADWGTGQGVEQDAFPDLDEAYVELVGGVRKASEVGSYEACFKLKDPETCEWADGSNGSGEIWVTWSIAPDTYDPNSGEVMYWGAAYDEATTTVAYTGKPIWVRPWYTPTKSAGGEFPEWVTHWGAANRPTNNRSSACVLYVNESTEDYAGIVGYHTNADGSLEPVTGAQVYAWMCGVEVGGAHVEVQSGDKVWYKVDDGDEVTVLAVQGEQPAGADGYIVARDLAYADQLGVKDEGAYEAYAFFDEGAGFAPTALVEAAVTVAKAENPMTAKGRAFTAPVGKKTVYPRSAAFKIANAQGTVTFKKASGNKKIAVNRKTGAITVKKGLKERKTYKVRVKVTAAGNSNYGKSTKTVMVKVKAAAKGDNPLTAKGKAVVASAKKGKAFKRADAFSVYGAQGAVSFEKVSGSKKIAVSEAGKVTVKKGLKEGKAYKVRVKVTAAGNGYYKRAAKTVTLTVKVK